jgi:hypothetical protein
MAKKSSGKAVSSLYNICSKRRQQRLAQNRNLMKLSGKGKG